MGHIIAVYGAQGGVGCTTVAVNLAVRLVRREIRILLMDMALPYGDIPVFLSLSPSSTLLDGLKPDIDEETLDHILTIHESGLRVLAAPRKIADAQSVYDNLDQLSGLLDVIQQDHDLIIVDMGHQPNPTTLEILNRAISIVLVLQPTLVSVKNARLTLDWFTQLDFPPDKIVPVLNRVSEEREHQRIAIPQRRIESALKLNVEALLPFDERAAEGAVNRGVPILTGTNHDPSLKQVLDTFSQYIYRMLVYDNDEKPAQPTPVKPSSSPFKRPSSASSDPASKSETTTLPVTSPSPPPASVVPPSKAKTTITILVVDQTTEWRDNIRKLLAFESDMKVIATASNGQEAVTLVKEHKPDIVIMDVDLPEMNGIEATRIIIKDVPTSSVILMSGDGSSDTIRRAMIAGARYFLTKPIPADELYDTVRMVYGRNKPDTAQYPAQNSPVMYSERTSNIPLRPAPDKSAAGKTEPHTNERRRLFFDRIDESSTGSSTSDHSSFLKPKPAQPTTQPESKPATSNAPNLDTVQPEESTPPPTPPTLLDMDQNDQWVEALEEGYLAALNDAKTQPAAETEQLDTIPDGLTSQMPEPTATSADTPDWLHDIEVDPADVPDWLKETLTSTEQEAGPKASTPDIVAAQPTSSISPQDPQSKPKSTLSQVQFSAYFPRQAVAEVQHGLYVYAHLYEVVSNIRRDVEKYRAELGGNIPQPRLAKSSVELVEGTRITIVPESDVLQFEPESLTKRWKPSWTRFEFDFTPSADYIDETAFVRVSIQIEGIEIAHIQCAVDVEKATPMMPMPRLAPNPLAASNPLAAAKLASERAESYRKIFISYSRQDNEIARAYKMAQTALGNDVFLDVDNLRSGENWQAALARAIDSADIFQLFWSEKYAQSEYCRYEWDYALKFRCPDNLCEGFIRPVYWSQPMPPPPTELSHLNFKFVPFEAQT